MVSKQFTNAALRLLIATLAARHDTSLADVDHEDKLTYVADLDNLISAMLKEAVDPLERSYIAIGPNVWGEGRDISAALDNLKQAGGSRTKYIMYSCPPGTQINDMGGLNYSGAVKMLGLAAPYEISRKGMKKAS